MADLLTDTEILDSLQAALNREFVSKASGDQPFLSRYDLDIAGIVITINPYERIDLRAALSEVIRRTVAEEVVRVLSV